MDGTKVEGSKTVTKTILGERTEKSEKIEVRPFVTETAHVSVKKGLPVNVGGTNAWLSIEIMMPCYVEEIKDAFKQVSDYVNECIDYELDIMGVGRS